MAESRGGSDKPNTVDRERVRAQMRVWQDRVLDLTKSNPLIGLNRSRVTKLRVTSPDAVTLFSRLAVDETTLKLPRVRKRSSGRTEPDQDSLLDGEEAFEWVVNPGDITFDAKAAELLRALKRLHDNARTTVEERGVTTLHLTFGALRWRDELFGDSVSPLWMVPCELENKGPDAPLRLRAVDEEAQINPALEYCLRERHKIRLPELVEDPDATSLTRLLRDVRELVREQHWDVTDEVWLSTFSFESLVIYRDLKALADVAVDHQVVATLARAVPAVGASEALGDDLDSTSPSSGVPIPVLSTDSSQLAALTVAATGRHVVVHGPPGTGKSQTIANLIADALSNNRKVLFVSAKMAALNVVHGRLKELGLQHFCLEAHSTKAGKQKIIDELRRTLEHEAVSDSSALDRDLQGLLRVREQLNAYARDLHKKIEPLSTTVHRAHGRLAQLHGTPDVRGPIPWPNPLTASREELNGCVEVLEELAANAATFDHRASHPWRGFAIEQFGVSEEEAIDAALRDVIQTCDRILAAATQLESLMTGAQDLSVREWMSLREPLLALSNTPELPKCWYERSVGELEAIEALFREGSSKKKELDTLDNDLRQVTVKPPSELVTVLADVRGRFRSWHAPLLLSFWRWRREARGAFRTGIRFSRRQCEVVLQMAARAVELQEWLQVHGHELGTYTTKPEGGTADELLALADVFSIARLWRQRLSAIGQNPAPVVTINGDVRNAIRDLLAALPTDGRPSQRAFQHVNRHWPHGFAGDAGTDDAPVPALLRRCGALVDSQHDVRDWVRLHRVLERCAARELSPFLESLGTVSAAIAPRVFQKRFWRLWVSAALEQHPSLTDFTQVKGADLLEKHRLLDERVRRLAVARAQQAASAPATRVKLAQDVPDTEVGILRYELQKKRRVKPLRKLFAEIPYVLQALKPCLLMSPISVSTYLNAKALRFDVVVFDEASQLPTAEAIPAILRAGQVVVAGDSNQLPPTSFFETSLIGDDDSGEAGDVDAQPVPLDSLLDDCVAIVPTFHEAHLRWHYRSRDERLIKFSNHFFYEKRLITFPAATPQQAGQGVRFVSVPDGIYDRGRSRTNRTEARVVARLAMEHFTQFPDRSLGIVALGLSQREAIEDALSEALANRPDLLPFFDTARDEAVFVKSLENVQGDERDTMLISVGYGRDENGGISMNFGPINADGGWRRLNVLVTRAKWECILVSSLRASDLAAINANNRGAVSLRAFLEFAERNGELPAEPAVVTEGETNDFEDAVRAALLDRGFSVDAQVGASQYRIDLAVRDRRDATKYVLGIECDGASYHSSRTARDRDLLRQQVLRGMNWRIHRVWSTEWFYERERAVDGILRSIEQAEHRPATEGVSVPVTESTEPPPNVGRQAKPAEVPRKYEAGVPYQVYCPDQRLNRDHLLQRTYTTVLARTIGELVAVEGPIHYDFLLERLKHLHGIERAGSNVQANIKQAIRQAMRWETIAHDPRSPFYRCQAHPLQRFRIGPDGVSRGIDQIAPEELALAVLYMVEDQFGVSEERAPSVIARLFGTERLWTENAAAIRSVIDDLVSKGTLRRSGTQLYLA
jgi:very-short-patch-repair endonuclease